MGAIIYFVWSHPSTARPDLWEPWIGARVILSGRNPYSLVGPGQPFPNEFLFIYPLTSSVLVIPLAGFSLNLATAIFVGISSALLAYAVTRDGWDRLILFFSVPFAAAAWGGQWSILFSAAFILPGFAWAYAAKPSIGAAMLLAMWSRRAWMVAIVGGIILALAAAVAVPQWPLEWLSAVRANTSHMTPPMFRTGGLVALLAMLRWKRPEARLIVLLALAPQTALWYEVVPLLLIARTRLETIALTVVTSLPILYEAKFGLGDGTFDVYPRGAQLAFFAYLPCVIMVLLRPNEGSVASSASGFVELT